MSLSSFFSLGWLQSQNLQVSKLPRRSTEPRQKEVFIRALTPSANPPGKPIPPPTPPPHTLTRTLTHTHTHATHRNTKSLCHAPSTTGSNMFWRLLLLCSNRPSVHIHRKEGAGEESKKQEEEESLVCGREQHRRKGPNLWHFQTGAGGFGRAVSRLPSPSWSLGWIREDSSFLGSPFFPYFSRSSRRAVGSRGESAHILPAPLPSRD